MWKKIKNYEDCYLINEHGIVKSLHSRNKAKDGIKKPYLGKRGYMVVDLVQKQRRKNAKIHRLVAVAFIPNPNNKPQVNHLDCNKLNNHVSNLEWVTASENIDHAIKNGLQVPYNYRHARKLTEETARKIKYAEGTHKQIAELYGVGLSTVTHIKLGSRWAHV